ncbi:GxxExxY protein [Halofilum ochraceum]|uniref:GxxExxY protein n=1 Tax=Halofilum ochraceum TaxID=1611323 RepID=UPI000833E53A|nr:GxxExxY protein [Halofilum ochraceum]
MEESEGVQGVMWDETRRVVGCAMRVLNHLGGGLLEKPYENALVVELEYQGIPYHQQPRFDVVYRGRSVGQFVPDLVVFDGLIVETKVIDQIGETEYGQVINYLRVTGLQAGLLLNFRQSRLQWKRVVL